MMEFTQWFTMLSKCKIIRRCVGQVNRSCRVHGFKRQNVINKVTLITSEKELSPHLNINGATFLPMHLLAPRVLVFQTLTTSNPSRKQPTSNHPTHEASFLCRAVDAFVLGVFHSKTAISCPLR